MIFLLLACSGETEPSTCEGFEPAPWDPVLEDDLRLTDETAVWEATGGSKLALTGGDCDGACLRIQGPGGASAYTRVNRMASYRLTGTLTSDAATTLTVRHTATDGATRTVWEGSLDAGTLDIDETFVVDAAGADLDILIATDGTETSLDDLSLVGERWAAVTDSPAGEVRLGFLVHVEEEDFIGDEENFWRKAKVLEGLSQVMAAHGAKLTIQADTAFIRGATIWDPEWIADRKAEGAGFSVHLHDEAVGDDLEQAYRDGRVTLDEAGADTTDVNGGFNLAPWLDMYRAGYRSLSAYKNGADQSGLPHVQLEPWRPADGTGTADPEAFMEHDPEGPLVYLPGYDTREADHTRFPEASANVLTQVLAHARPDYVDTWYFVLHVDGFVPRYGDDIDVYLDEDLATDLAFYDAFLTDTVDPLVDAGSVRYATTLEMFTDWLEWAAPCAE